MQFAALGLLVLMSAFRAISGELPAPTGPEAVGRVLLRWRDDSRPETLSNRAGDRREVTVWIWYPAEPASGREAAPYVEDLKKLEPVLSKDQISLVRSIRTHTTVAAVPAKAPPRFPVLLFSPGGGSSPALYTAICEELASHGYVVVALDHPYDSAAVMLSDGRVVKHVEGPTDGRSVLPFDRERANVRARDMLFVLSQLKMLDQGEMNSPLQSRLDLSSVGAFGHSIGGKAAAHACVLDQRLKACANVDGHVRLMPAHPEDAGAGFRQPFLFLEKVMTPSPQPGETPSETARRWSELRERASMLLNHPETGTSYRITVAGATHAGFSDEEVISRTPGDPDRDRYRSLLQTTRDYLRFFFGQCLRGEVSPQLQSGRSAYGITVETFDRPSGVSR